MRRAARWHRLRRAPGATPSLGAADSMVSKMGGVRSAAMAGRGGGLASLAVLGPLDSVGSVLCVDMIVVPFTW
jgi:hypothetical protein